MYTVYVLELKGKKRFYIGVTGNFERRLLEHRFGKVTSTKRRFYKVIHKEEFSTKEEAWKREKFLKSGKGREWLHEKFD